MLTGKLTTLNVCIKKEISQINNMTSHLMELGKEQTKPKASRMKEIIMIRMEMNSIENRKQ